MKSFQKDIQKYSEEIHMKASERRELRERLLSYMAYHPLPHKQEKKRSPVFDMIPISHFITIPFSIHSRSGRALIGLSIALVIITPLAAERSVPGDVLYAVKTGVTEPMQGQLAVTQYAKIEHETKLMERRIAEARELAHEGKLTEEVETQIVDTIRAHTASVQTSIAALESEDVDSAALAKITFNTSLEVQSAVLGANLAAEDGSATSSIDTILSAVQEAQGQVNVHTEGEQPSFDILMAEVESETTRAYELFENIKKSATTEDVADIDRRIADINRLVEEAKKQNTFDTTTATLDLTTTLGLLQKLIVYMTDIDVRETVALETIVPMILSDAERLERVTVALNLLDTDARIVLERMTRVTDPQLVEKVEVGLEVRDDRVLKARVALDLGDVDAIEQWVIEARQITDDLLVLTEAFKAEPVSPDTQSEFPTPEEVPTAAGATTTPSTSTPEDIEPAE